MSEPKRLEAANLLEAIASKDEWDDDLFRQFHAVLDSTTVDGLLAYAYDELNHYSGEFNSYYLFGMKAKPDRSRIQQHHAEFKEIARCLREGVDWDRYKRANNIVESSVDFKAWLKRSFCE